MLSGHDTVFDGYCKLVYHNCHKACLVPMRCCQGPAIYFWIGDCSLKLVGALAFVLCRRGFLGSSILLCMMLVSQRRVKKPNGLSTITDSPAFAYSIYAEEMTKRPLASHKSRQNRQTLTEAKQNWCAANLRDVNSLLTRPKPDRSLGCRIKREIGDVFDVALLYNPQATMDFVAH